MHVLARAVCASFVGLLLACGDVGDGIRPGFQIGRADVVGAALDGAPPPQPLVDADTQFPGCAAMQDDNTMRTFRGDFDSCLFEYQLAKAREAYDRAFSFVDVPSATERSEALDVAAYRFYRGAAYPFVAYKQNSAIVENHYVAYVKKDPTFPLCNSATFGPPPTCTAPEETQQEQLRTQYRVEALDYYFTTAHRALERYIEVVIEASRFWNARSDDTSSVTGGVPPATVRDFVIRPV